MSKHDVSVPTETGNTSERVEQFLAGVYALQIPSQIERRERRLYAVGIVTAIAGFAVIGMGWWGASGTKYVYQEIPYVISGGIFGISLVVVGAALFRGTRRPDFCASGSLVSLPTSRSRPTALSTRSRFSPNP